MTAAIVIALLGLVIMFGLWIKEVREKRLMAFHHEAIIEELIADHNIDIERIRRNHSPRITKKKLSWALNEMFWAALEEDDYRTRMAKANEIVNDIKFEPWDIRGRTSKDDV